MARSFKLALIGFGNVGQGLATIFRDNSKAIAEQQGAEFTIVSVNTAGHGSVYNPNGLDPGVLLSTYEQTGRVDSMDAPNHGWDVPRVIYESNADVIVELTASDLLSGEPAASYIRAALRNNRHVVTTNKGPIALYYPELSAIAAERGVMLGVEGTVMGGTPLLRVGRDLLAAAGISRIQGIMNGTSNYILTRMAEGKSFKAALKEAQEKGYAEANPTADVDGYDSAIKLVIMANILLGIPLRRENVEREGIRDLSNKDIARANEAGEVWKLVGWVERTPDMVKASVRPIRLPQNHTLASVSGATNAVTFATRLLGDVTIIGPGAGRVETGYAVLSDLLEIHQRTEHAG